MLAHASQDLVPYVTSVLKEEIPTGKTQYEVFKEQVKGFQFQSNLS